MSNLNSNINQYKKPYYNDKFEIKSQKPKRSESTGPKSRIENKLTSLNVKKQYKKFNSKLSTSDNDENSSTFL